MVPRFPSIPAIDAFQLQPTPFDSNPDPPSSDELDLNLMALLKTNINTARAGGQEDAAMFMEKIYAAAAKFVDGA